MRNIKVRYWKRPIESKEVNPYLYYFLNNDDIIWDDILDVPSKFLKIPDTALYEYGGSHEESLSSLINVGFDDIKEIFDYV